MNSNISKRTGPWLALAVIASILAACVAGTPTPQAPAPTQPPQPTAAPRVVTSIGVTLPPDAAPLDEQVLRLTTGEATWLTI